jgi:hypothetical protein
MAGAAMCRRYVFCFDHTVSKYRVSWTQVAVRFTSRRRRKQHAIALAATNVVRVNQMCTQQKIK